MPVRIVLDIIVEGEEEDLSDTERSIKRNIEYFRSKPHSAEYHELIAHIAMMTARLHWREADLYKRLEKDHRDRIARKEARIARKIERRSGNC